MRDGLKKSNCVVSILLEPRESSSAYLKMGPPGWKRTSSNSISRSPRSSTRRYWQYGSKVLSKADNMILRHCMDHL